MESEPDEPALECDSVLFGECERRSSAARGAGTASAGASSVELVRTGETTMFGRALRATAAVAIVAGVTVMVERPESLLSLSRRDPCSESWSGSVIRGMGGNSSSTGVSNDE